MTTLIEMIDVSKEFVVGGEIVRALDRVSLRVKVGEQVAVLGSSGSGKSTMMSILGCLDTPSGGSYTLAGQDTATMSPAQLATTRNREIGFVFQNFNLLERSTALDNVSRPLVYRGISRAERAARARASLAAVGLADRMHHRPSQLSGGQRQRVAIARALCGRPALILADEPTGNLDSSTAAEIMAMLEEVHASGNTVVLVTHDAALAARCRRRITLHDGRVVDDSVGGNC